jgi:hypothetical protein
MSEQPITLWTHADIAKELGIGTTTVYNWTYYQQRSITMPEPFAVTRKGAPLWTDTQAQTVMSDYRALRRRREQRKAAKEREKKVLELLTSV